MTNTNTENWTKVQLLGGLKISDLYQNYELAPNLKILKRLDSILLEKSTKKWWFLIYKTVLIFSNPTSSDSHISGKKGKI